MKSKKTNILLGIIAINLTLITLIQLEIWPTKANANELGLDPSINYVLVPLNENGSINVNLTSSTVEAMDVNIRYISGSLPWISTSKTGYAVLGVYSESSTLQ